MDVRARATLHCSDAWTAAPAMRGATEPDNARTGTVVLWANELSARKVVTLCSASQRHNIIGHHNVLAPSRQVAKIVWHIGWDRTFVLFRHIRDDDSSAHGCHL